MDTEKNNPCFVCERRGGNLEFSENYGADVKLSICMECVAIGVRWIVKKAREEEQAQNK